MPVGGAILGSAVIGGAVGISSANKAAKASQQATDANAQLSRETAARNEALALEQLKENAGLITGARDATTDLLTGARDQTASTLGNQQRAAFGTATTTHEDALRTADIAKAANDATIRSGLDEIVNRSDWTAMRNDADLLAARQGAVSAADATRTGNLKTLGDTRDANVNLFKDAEGRNAADITGYGDKAAGAITGVMDEQRNLFNPYVQQGNLATNRINALLNLSGDPRAADDAFKAWRDSTGYDFQVKEGERGVTGNQAALGLMESGDAAKALTRYRTGLADQTFGNYFDRVAGQQGVGLNAAGSLSSALTSGAGQLAGVYQNTGASLVGNRNLSTAGQAGANSDYATGSVATNNGYRDAVTAAGNNYATGSNANQNTRLGVQTGAITNATTSGINNTNNWAGATTAANNDFGKAVGAANDNYFGGLINNANLFATNQAQNLTGAAQNLAGLNTSTTNSIIGGNNTSAGQIMQGNTANAGAQGNAALTNAGIINGVLQNGVNAFAYSQNPGARTTAANTNTPVNYFRTYTI